MKCPDCGGNTRVLETRAESEGMVTKRRHRCSNCDRVFGSVQVYDEVWPTIRKWAVEGNGRAVLKRRALFRRNEQILQRLATGEKHASIASDFHLSDGMVSTIAARAGLAGRHRIKTNQEKTQ